jgi:hypothetical protein
MMDHLITVHMTTEKYLGYLLSMKVVLCWCDPLRVASRTLVDQDFFVQLM